MPTATVRRVTHYAACFLVVTLFLLAGGAPSDGATILVPAAQPTIQAAVNSASPGDVIEVANGTYSENVDLSLMGSAIGGGMGDLTIRAAMLYGATIDGGTGSAVEAANFTGNITLDGLRLDADAGMTGAVVDLDEVNGIVTLDALYFPPGYGGKAMFIGLSGTTQTTVEVLHADLVDPADNQDGLEIEVADSAELDLIVRQSHFEGMRDDAIKVNVQSPGAPRVSARITDNIFNPAAAIGNCVDFDLGDSGNTGTFASVLIADNIMNSALDADILIDLDGPNTTAWVIVRDNTIGNSEDESIRIEGSTNSGGITASVRIDDNQITQGAVATDDGILIRPQALGAPSTWDVAIRGNTVTGAGRNGIEIDANATQDDYTLNLDIRDNSVASPAVLAYDFDQAGGGTVNLEQGASASTVVPTVLTDNGNVGTPVVVAGTVSVVVDALDDDLIPATLGGRAWEDLNISGIQDPGEPALPRIPFAFTGTLNIGGTVGWATVGDLAGAYRFPAVLPGSFTITVTPPAGATLVPANQGGDPTVDSDFIIDTASVTLGIDNDTTDAGIDLGTPPIVLCGSDQTVACAGPAGTSVTVSYGVTEPTGKSFDVEVAVDGTVESSFTVPAGTPPTIINQLFVHTYVGGGDHLVEVTATNSAGLTDSCDLTVTVQDNTPPVITAGLLRPLLWPARRGMLPIGFSASATDACDGPVGVTVDVFSDEDDGTAPFAPDAVGTSPTNLRLRCERAYPGDGRVYLIRVTATDGAGNTAVACRSIIVPVMPVGTWILNARTQALAAEMACASAPSVAPLPFLLHSFSAP